MEAGVVEPNQYTIRGSLFASSQVTNVVLALMLALVLFARILISYIGLSFEGVVEKFVTLASTERNVAPLLYSACIPACATSGCALIMRKYIFNFSVFAKAFHLPISPLKIRSCAPATVFVLAVKSLLKAVSMLLNNAV